MISVILAMVLGAMLSEACRWKSATNRRAQASDNGRFDPCLDSDASQPVLLESRTAPPLICEATLQTQCTLSRTRTSSLRAPADEELEETRVECNTCCKEVYHKIGREMDALATACSVPNPARGVYT